MSLEAKIELLTAAVAALTVQLQNAKPSTAYAAETKDAPATKDAPVTKAPAADKVPAGKSATGGGDTPSPELLKQVNAEVNTLVAAGRTKDAAGVLAEFGVKKTSQLPAGDLAGALAQLKALNAAATAEDEGSLV